MAVILADYQRRLIELALRTDALQFGEFTLKSGRVAPYFSVNSPNCSASVRNASSIRRRW